MDIEKEKLEELIVEIWERAQSDDPLAEVGDYIEGEEVYLICQLVEYIKENQNG